MSNFTIPLLKLPSCGYIKQGDTIPKKTITFTDGYTGDFTTATIKMQVYEGNETIIDISNGSGITVLTSNSLEIDKVQNNDLPDGTFTGDFEVTEANGDKTTYFNVSYTIIKEYTV